MKIRIKRPKGFLATVRWFFTPVPGGAARRSPAPGPRHDTRLEHVVVYTPAPRLADTGSESSGGDCGGGGD